MAITFACDGCGKSYTVGDRLAGKPGTCKQCGRKMVVPGGDVAVVDAYGLDEAAEASAPLPPRDRARRPASARGASRSKGGLGIGRVVGYLKSLREPSRPGFFAFGKNEAIRLVLCLASVAVLFYIVNDRIQQVKQRTRVRQFIADSEASRPKPQARPVEIKLPDFPEPGPAREIEPGVLFREVAFGPPRRLITTPPGGAGKLWLYLPSGDHPPRSLPGVLIAPAGSNLLSGKELDEGDRAEHLPYVRAGFAVLAFEMEGTDLDFPKPEGPVGSFGNSEQIRLSMIMSKFARARAGLANAQVALGYLLAKVPEVDPARISSAGHSSAGTLAVLFAETEPRLRSCVAFAPVVDVKAAFGRAEVQAIAGAGAGQLLADYSPVNNEAGLRCPTFLFVARDDPVAGQVEAFAKRLQGQARPVTLRTVPVGGHYDPMIQQGIPAAIDWLRGQDKGGG